MMEGRRVSMDAAASAVAGNETNNPSAGAEEPKTLGIGFANLTRAVAAKWKELPEGEKVPFKEAAAKEKARYQAEMAVWRARQEQKKESTARLAQAQPDRQQVAQQAIFTQNRP